MQFLCMSACNPAAVLRTPVMTKYFIVHGKKTCSKHIYGPLAMYSCCLLDLGRLLQCIWPYYVGLNNRLSIKTTVTCNMKTCYRFLLPMQCSDTVNWLTGMAFGLKNVMHVIPQSLPLERPFRDLACSKCRRLIMGDLMCDRSGTGSSRLLWYRAATKLVTYADSVGRHG